MPQLTTTPPAPVKRNTLTKNQLPGWASWAVLAVALVLGAAPAGAATSIEAVDNAFRPKTATVSVGDRITWRNTGQAPHEVRSTAFSSGNIAPGASWSWTASRAGTFRYVCSYHEAVGMTGTLVVQSASGLPNTGGDRIALGLLVLGVSAIAGASLRYGWRVR